MPGPGLLPIVGHVANFVTIVGGLDMVYGWVSSSTPEPSLRFIGPLKIEPEDCFISEHPSATARIRLDMPLAAATAPYVAVDVFLDRKQVATYEMHAHGLNGASGSVEFDVTAEFEAMHEGLATVLFAARGLYKPGGLTNFWASANFFVSWATGGRIGSATKILQAQPIPSTGPISAKMGVDLPGEYTVHEPLMLGQHPALLGPWLGGRNYARGQYKGKELYVEGTVDGTPFLESLPPSQTAKPAETKLSSTVIQHLGDRHPKPVQLPSAVFQVKKETIYLDTPPGIWERHDTLPEQSAEAWCYDSSEESPKSETPARRNREEIGE